MFIAVDVGGTFTDIVAISESGELYQLKALTRVDKPWENVFESVAKLRSKSKDDEKLVVFHATTLATNMLLGQIGLEMPRTALLITKGFRGLPAIGRQNRPRLYDPFFSKPKQLISDDMIFEVNERTSSSGELIVPVDESEISKIGELLSEARVESAAIVYLNSFINPSNELITEKVISDKIRFLACSHKVSPTIREYERASTTIIHAILMPRMHNYLEKLSRSLSELNASSLYLMSSSGGLIDWEEAASKPGLIIESGPAAGVIGASIFASLLNEQAVISFDMGGTTAKASSIINGIVSVTTDYEVGGEVHHGRLVKGSGYPIKHVFIDLAEVSAGGGTVIWRDSAGALRVGPMSVGSSPGPMSYGLGGNEPTITDANVALGRIPARLSLGGISLNEELAIKGLSKLGDPYEVSSQALKIANLEMARAIRLVTSERGYDPSGFTLFAYGGGGPLHATGVADELGLSKVLVPPLPGLFSSLSLLLSDILIEASAFVKGGIDEALKKVTDEIKARLENFDSREAKIIYYIEARYRGQGWELILKIPDNSREKSIKELFDRAHERIYGYYLDEDVEVISVRAAALLESPFRKNVLKILSEKYSRLGQDCRAEYTKVYFDGFFEKVPVYCRSSIDDAGGPLVIIDYGSTVYVDRGWKARTGELYTLILERE